MLIIAIQQIEEVPQLYASDPVCSVLRLEKELKAFEKIFLNPGETKTIELTIKVADLAFYDEVKKTGMWKRVNLFYTSGTHQIIFWKK